MTSLQSCPCSCVLVVHVVNVNNTPHSSLSIHFAPSLSTALCIFHKKGLLNLKEAGCISTGGERRIPIESIDSFQVDYKNLMTTCEYSCLGCSGVEVEFPGGIVQNEMLRSPQRSDERPFAETWWR